MLNKWECGHIYESDIDGYAKAGERCKSTCVGVGGAVGLLAIGWYFKIGEPMFCPAHRPDKIPCHDDYSRENFGKPCSGCRAEAEAERYQAALKDLDALDVRKAERLLDDDRRRELEAFRAGNEATAKLIDEAIVERDLARARANDAIGAAHEVQDAADRAKKALEDALAAWLPGPEDEGDFRAVTAGGPAHS